MKCYKSRWILTSEDEVLENMALVVDDGKIIDIIPNDSVNFEEKCVKNLGNAVITPGFIDLLTQFQYTNIESFKPQNLNSRIKKLFMTIFLKDTFAGVKQNVYSFKWAKILSKYFVMNREDKIKSFDDGVESAIAAGTTCVGQVSKEFKFFDTINKMPIKNYLFFEIFADSSEKSKKQFKEIRAKLEDLIMHKGENTHIGIMLNSISGVHKKLWELFSKYCRKHNMILLTRFAESKDELEWLEHGFSDIDLLHKYMGMNKITPYDNDIDAVDYLANLKVLSKKVITANANYLTEEELQKLSDSDVKYVYQPHYSEEICNKKLDFKTVLKYFPKRFGFSSQSFKSEKDFSLLKLAVDANKDNLLDVVELVKYLTIYPAKILRLDNETGSIKIGKDADFNVFKLEEGETYKDLVTKHNPYSTYSRGRKIVKRGDIRFSL
ncbi:MAG: amidohydrolase family protein [Clostridiaceae bacterium]|jgi:cytosine/adenosine deaminase-related metal-dependent hydrolase|nr:amidohydrolase family protein [Clostridiaceae bacterium]